MVEAARALALNSSERTHWHTLAHHSKAVSDTIKSLVTNIRYTTRPHLFKQTVFIEDVFLLLCCNISLVGAFLVIFISETLESLFLLYQFVQRV